MKIDIFCHIFPKPFFDKMVEIAPDKGAIKRWLNIPILWDLDARLRMMDSFPGYQQVLTLSLPTIESLAGPDYSPELARIANDGMAEIVRQRPDKFPAFVASMPMNNVPAAVKEMKRAIEELGAKGIQIFTNVNGRPLDDPEFLPIFEAIDKYDMPIWLHPFRPAGMADYPGEKKSKYEIWWTFGWPYETSAAMARLVFSGYLDRFPKLKVITHHMGAMVPYLEARVGYGWDQLGTRTADEDYGAILKKMAKRPVEYFRMFYADTSVNGSVAAMECGIAFYGIDHCLFATDCPFDPEGGPLFIREIIKGIDGMDLTDSDRKKLYEGNALKMLRMPATTGARF